MKTKQHPQSFQLWPTTKLIPNPTNPRVIKDDKFAKLVQSIRDFPEMLEARPIVCSPDGVVLGGNMRLKACLEAGLKEVPVYIANWESDKNGEFIIKDNVGYGEWDWDILANEWDAAELEAWGLDVWVPEKTEEGLTDPDEVPAAPKEATTQLGDVYVLGNHRLICGDSREPDTVARLMAGQKANLLLTDPPYNVDYQGGTKEKLKIENDSMSDSDFRTFLFQFLQLSFENMNEGAAFYIWHADSEGYNFRGAVKDCGQEVKQCLIWNKSALVMGRQDYQWKHEPCLYGWKAGAGHGWYSDRKQTTILEFDKPSKNADHPTMKPVELFTYLMVNSSQPKEIVYDPFLGSGTTVIAAEQTGRACYGIELDPKYCDVIVKRWEEFTGKKATKEATNVLPNT